jgi:hypothetical protein
MSGMKGMKIKDIKKGTMKIALFTNVTIVARSWPREKI